eukprot:scaffold644722_cov45-Prasinocladus_malaysianus.AAC.2
MGLLDVLDGDNYHAADPTDNAILPGSDTQISHQKGDHKCPLGLSNALSLADLVASLSSPGNSATPGFWDGSVETEVAEDEWRDLPGGHTCLLYDSFLSHQRYYGDSPVE